MLISNSIYILVFCFYFFFFKQSFIVEYLFIFDPEGLVLELQPCFEGNLPADFGPILHWLCSQLCLYKVCQASETA